MLLSYAIQHIAIQNHMPITSPSLRALLELPPSNSTTASGHSCVVACREDFRHYFFSTPPCPTLVPHHSTTTQRALANLSPYSGPQPLCPLPLSPLLSKPTV